MSNPWLEAGVAILCLLCGLCGRAIRGRRARLEIDQAYEVGWRDRWHRADNDARKRLAAGFVLRAGADGRPVWVRDDPPPLGPSFDPDGPGWEPAPTDRLAIDARYYDTAPQSSVPAALTLPPGEAAGTEADPPGPDGAGVDDPPVTTAACFPPSRSGTGAKADSPGPGDAADPIFDVLDDTGAFALIAFELRHIKILAAEPFRLSEWRAATA